MSIYQTIDASNVIVVLTVLNDSNAAVGSIAYDDAELSVDYRKDNQSTWTEIALATATLGSYTSGGWIETATGSGIYELGLPAAAVNLNGATYLRVTYSTFAAQQGAVYFTLSNVNASTNSVFVLDATGGGSHITITQGDTFDSSDTTLADVLTFTKDSGESWPTLSAGGWSVTLYATEVTSNIAGENGSDAFNWSATVVSDTSFKFNDLTGTSSYSVGDRVYEGKFIASKTGEQQALRNVLITVQQDHT